MPKPNLRIYNTLTGKKDIFKPRKGKKVNLFVCGPTVYDFAHIGHARTYVIFDCFARYLKARGYTVFYLQNVTDVDDKIIARARERGVEGHLLADAFLKEHLKDMKLLGITSVNRYAKATDYIKQIVSQVQRLQKKGYAYTLDDGIYFDIAKFKDYGKLSGRSVLQAEDSVSRIDYSAKKKNRGDFCLWKFTRSHSEDEPSWKTLLGAGRPGWHIEDTAITEKFFGAQYDIHGGARDLIFPHHEAEIAQMEAVSGRRPLAKYWMHTGFLTVGEQKMGKSLGNSMVLGDFLKRHSVQQLRFWIAKNLWHSPMDYSEAVMIESRAALEKIEEFLRKLRDIRAKVSGSAAGNLLKTAQESFYAALDDDFNTPKAFATLFDFVKEINILMSHNELTSKDAKAIGKFFVQIDKIFGIIDQEKLKTSGVPAEVLVLLDQRQEHRRHEEWQQADQVRMEIEKYGYAVEDTPAGPVLKKISHL